MAHAPVWRLGNSRRCGANLHLAPGVSLANCSRAAQGMCPSRSTVLSAVGLSSGRSGQGLRRGGRGMIADEAGAPQPPLWVTDHRPPRQTLGTGPDPIQARLSGVLPYLSEKALPLLILLQFECDTGDPEQEALGCLGRVVAAPERLVQHVEISEVTTARLAHHVVAVTFEHSHQRLDLPDQHELGTDCAGSLEQLLNSEPLALSRSAAELSDHRAQILAKPGMELELPRVG